MLRVCLVQLRVYGCLTLFVTRRPAALGRFPGKSELFELPNIRARAACKAAFLSAAANKAADDHFFCFLRISRLETRGPLIRIAPRRLWIKIESWLRPATGGSSIHAPVKIQKHHNSLLAIRILKKLKDQLIESANHEYLRSGILRQLFITSVRYYWHSLQTSDLKIPILQ